MLFTATIRKSGPSFVVTIPHELVKKYRLKEGMLIDLTATKEVKK